jgi:hypothetical protein
MGWLGKAATEVELETSRLKKTVSEINSKPIKLAVDYVQLEQAQKRLKELQENQAAFEEFLKQKTPAEKEAGARAKEFLAAVPGGTKKLGERLAEAERLEKEGASIGIAKAKAEYDEALEDVRAYERWVNGGPAPKRETAGARKRMAAATNTINMIKEDIKQKAKDTIGDLLKRTEEGYDPEARAALAERLSAIGHPGTGEAITSLATPAAIHTERHERQEIARQSKAAKDAAERQRKTEAEAAQHARQLDAMATVQANHILDSLTKTPDLGNRVTDRLRQLAAEGGAKVGGQFTNMDPAVQFRHLQAQLRDELIADLKNAGITGEGPVKAADQAATQLVGHAEHELGRLAAKHQREADAAAKKAEHAVDRIEQKQFNAVQKALERSPLELQAEAMINQYRAQGGAVGGHGELPQAQFDWLAAQVQKQLQRNAPKMSDEDAGRHSRKLVERAQSGIENKLLNMSGMGLDLTSEHMGITRDLMSQMANHQQQMQILRQELGNLRRGVTDLHRRNLAEQRSGLPSGGGSMR